jgi:hypothetical protein
MFDRIIEIPKLILSDGKQKYLGALTDLYECPNELVALHEPIWSAAEQIIIPFIIINYTKVFCSSPSAAADPLLRLGEEGGWIGLIYNSIWYKLDIQ